MQRLQTGWFVVAALGIAAPIGCDRDETDVHSRAKAGSEITVVEPSREESQAAPPGEVVAQLLRSAEPEITIYDAPPDLGRPDLGVVYLPSGPSAAPASGFGDTLGVGRPMTGPQPGGATPGAGASGRSPAPTPVPRDTTGS